MALWLCRLEPDGLEAVGRDDRLARQLGIGGWVLPVQLGQGVEEAMVELHRLFESADGLPLLLEWLIKEPSEVREESWLIAQLGALMSMPRAAQLEGRPALLIQGSGQLDQPSLTALRMRRGLAQRLGRVPLLLNAAAESGEGFDGCCDWTEPPFVDGAFEKRHHKASYELFLQQAHWRAPPRHALSIPAVRALSQREQSAMEGGSPELYQSWLRLLSHWSALLRNGDPQAPVLIDSWSGHQGWWTPLAPPEPLPPPAADAEEPRIIQWGMPSAERLAVMVHGFYLDGLAAIIERLPTELLSRLDLYVSAPRQRMSAVAALLRRRGCPVVHLFGVPNRGRDIAPFVLHLLPAVLAHGHRGFLKLHTKSSPHLSDGEDWGEHLLNSLLEPSLLQGLLAQLQHDPSLGLLAPAGTRVPITLQLQNNGDHLLQLQRRTGLRGLELLGSDFVAGSMFAGRVSVLEPLLKLELQLSDFEPEAAQTDGTLAHGLERWIGVQAHHLGLRIDELAGDPRSMPGFGYRWSRNQGEPQTAIRMGSSQTTSVRDFPLIDSPLFSAHRREGLFGDQLAVADQLHQQGYAVIDLGRERMASLAVAIKNDLKSHFDPEVQAWKDRGATYSPRLQDAWQHSDAVRELALMQDIALLLKTCWGREPFAFQTLNFPVGTQQELHSDAVHFHTEPAGFMCGVWVPLEDIHPDSGPLLYVPGTHRLPYVQAADVGVVQRDGWTPTQEIFEPYWQTAIASDEFKVQRFTPRLGQALIWTANLIHGGSDVADSGLSRWSQVTHYFFDNCRYYTPMLSDWPEGPVAWRNPFDIARGCERVMQPEGPNGVLAPVQALAASHGWSLQKLVGSSLSSDGMEQALLEEAIASREAGEPEFSLALMEWALEAGFSSPWLQDNRARALVHLQRLNEACDLWRELAQPHHTAALQSAAREMLYLHGLRPQLEAALLSGDLSAADQVLDPLLEQGQSNGPLEWQPLVASLDQQGLMPWLLPLLEARLDSHPSEGLFRLIDGLRLLRGAAHLDQLLRVSQEQLLAFGWRAASGEAVMVARTNTGRWIQARSTGPNLRRPDVAELLQLPALSDAGFLAVLALEPGESLTGLWLQGHQQALDVRDLRGLPYIDVVDQLLQLCQAGLTLLERAPALFDAGIGQALQHLVLPLKSQEQWQGLVARRECFGRQAPEAEITVVIPLYRRWDFILGHVAGFCQDPWFVEQRVRLMYVIDDPALESPLLDWSYGNLADEQLDITFLILKRNCGFALACNCGVQAAETDLVFLMNSDVLPLTIDWLSPLTKCVEDHPDAMIAPLLLSDEGLIQHAGMSFDFKKTGSLPRCIHTFKGLDPSCLHELSFDAKPYSVEALSGAALMLRKQRFLDHGGFDPVFGRGDFEDLEFSIRWKSIYGGPLLIAPESKLMHLERQSFETLDQPLNEWRQLLNAWHVKNLTSSLIV